MKRTLRHLYGAGALFFYFFKWPFAAGLPLLYGYYGLHDNPILDVLWLYCTALIAKDAVLFFLKHFRHR